VTPLLLAAAGVAALVGAGAILRTFGGSYRVARLLATTPRVSVAEANRLAAARRRAYVRVDGRIDADDEFEGPDHQPLVVRRVRLETRSGRTWRTFEDHRQAVPFRINEGLDSIAVDVDGLDRGLVVVPRESVGSAADLADRVPSGVRPDTPVRARILQLSSVEHAIVLGSPTLDAAGSPRLAAGRGRPLVVTVLEPDEAMRVLAGDGRTRTRWAAALLGAGAVLLLGAVGWALTTALLPAVADILPAARGLVPGVLAASPEPSIAAEGDPRSNGQGPGLVGTPGLAILGVVVIAIIAIVVTSIYVRVTAPSVERGGAGRPARKDPPPRKDPPRRG
jgi:hypothetical protein